MLHVIKSVIRRYLYNYTALNLSCTNRILLSTLFFIIIRLLLRGTYLQCGNGESRAIHFDVGCTDYHYRYGPHYIRSALWHVIDVLGRKLVSV